MKGSQSGSRPAYEAGPSSSSTQWNPRGWFGFNTPAEERDPADLYGGDIDDDEDNMVTVIWSGEKFKIPLPPADAPLSALKQAIEERTGVPPEHQKLIMGGAIMKKDLPLKTYGLVKPSLRDEPMFRTESELPSFGLRKMLGAWGLGKSEAAGARPRELKITMVGSKDTSAVVSDRLPGSSSTTNQSTRQPQPTAPPTASRLDEPRMVAQMDSLVKNTLEKLKPTLDAVLKPEDDQATSETPTPRRESRKQQSVIASEMLLQALLKLDSYDVEPTWTEARKARKESIRQIQGILDQVDAVKDQA